MRFKSFLLGSVIVSLALVATLWNIRGFPMMVGDEGIYVSQAWWLAHFHTLGPYTYWYDHFPLGWAQIGFWQLLTGGPFAFGLSVFSSRIFMAILKALSVLFLYLVAKHVSKSRLLGFFTAMVYIASPLALTFNRQVLLDNIAAFWLLLHLWLVVTKKYNGTNIFFASLTLAIAILSKESLLFVLPIYLYSVLIGTTTQHNRPYTRLIAFITLFFLLSFFPLLALLKHELVAANGTVSFIDTLRFQSTRGSHFPLWDSRSDFRQAFDVWLKIDPILVFAGLGSLLANLFFQWKNKAVRLISLYTLAFTTFLTRGGLIYDFYIIPLLPLLTLSLSVVLSKLSLLTRSKWLSCSFFVLILLTYAYNDRYIFVTAATQNQIDSLTYAHQAFANSRIVADNYAYLDLSLNSAGEVANQNIFWYSKAETDPAVKEKRLQNDPHNIDLMIVNDFLNRQLVGGQLPFLTQTLTTLPLSKTFGTSLPPTAKPYTGEAVTAYSHTSSTNLVSQLTPEEKIDQLFILSFDGPTVPADLPTILEKSQPYGIIVGFQNITNSTQLETLMQNLKSTKPSRTMLITQQSDSGQISIPWIGTILRNTYKSSLEAKEATIAKSRQLANLGFQANIVTMATNQDGLLDSITSASESLGVLPLLEQVVDGNPVDTEYLILAYSTPQSTLINPKNAYVLESPNSVDTSFIMQKLSEGYKKFIVDANVYSNLKDKLQELYKTDPTFTTQIDSL